MEGRKAWVKGHIETVGSENESPTVLAEAEALFISPRFAKAISVSRRVCMGLQKIACHSNAGEYISSFFLLLSLLGPCSFFWRCLGLMQTLLFVSTLRSPGCAYIIKVLVLAVGGKWPSFFILKVGPSFYII